MANKLTKAQVDKILRGLAFDKIMAGEKPLQVAGSKFAINVEYEGNPYVVRVDFVVPKEQDYLAEDLHDEYMASVAEKEAEKAEKAKAKAKKIARDEKLRAEKKALKEAKAEGSNEPSDDEEEGE